jgi:hypothetical protein
LCCLVLVVTLITAGCKKKVKPLSERIAKSWTAESVKHNATVVYTRGGSSNSVPGYSSWRLNLSAGTATYSEFDGNTFTGTWELEGESKLILKNLTPQPSGSGGIMEFSIISIDDAKLVIKNLKGNKKTGDTLNEYTLSTP